MYLKLFIIITIVLFVMYLISEWLCKKQTAPYRAASNSAPSIADVSAATKVTIPTIQIPEMQDFSYMIEDIRNAFGKLYQRLNKTPVNFKHCVSELPTSVYFGKTKYTGETNRNGKREVALLLSDGAIAGKLNRKDWNNYEKYFNTDGLNWIGIVVDGDFEISVADKFKEEYVKQLLKWSYPQMIVDSGLRSSIIQEVERQNLSTGEFHNNKEEREKGYEEGTYELDYNGKYQIAGCYHYVNAPFVSVGYAENEPTNEYNPKAMIVKTLGGIKVGYVAEKELQKFYKETGGVKIPLIMEAHYYNGKLYGWMYTYTDNVEEYPYMENQYHKLLNEKSKIIL